MADSRLVDPKWAVAVLALTLVVDARAGQTVDQYLSFSEFGTLGAVHSDYGQADFIGNVVQLRGAGYSGSWSVTTDSDLGVQANLTLTDKLSGVVQVLSRDNAEGNFKPDLEWVNLKYDFTANFSVRAGRILLPTFQLSDVQNVGYALPMVRIPLEFNYTDSAEHSDGVELLYRMKTGPVAHLLQAQVTRSSMAIPAHSWRINITSARDTRGCGRISSGWDSLTILVRTFSRRTPTIRRIPSSARRWPGMPAGGLVSENSRLMLSTRRHTRMQSALPV
jgi:hypothetical protein